MPSPDKCLLGRIRDELDEQNQKELDFMLCHPEKYSLRVVARALTALGHSIKKDCVHSHVQGDCRCPR